MIYIPIELQLQWIREDLERIKQAVIWYERPTINPPCPDCDYAKSLGLGQTTCTYHAPEFAMRIQFPL